MRSCDSSGDVATATMDHRACGKEKESTADTKATAAAVEACATDSRFSCNICFEEVTEPVVTRCGHLYCWPCLFQWLEPGMHRHEREQLGMHIPHAAYYGSGNGDSSRRVCPVCKSECPVSSIVPVYVRSTSSSSPAVAAAATTTTTTVAASSSRSCFSHDDNDGNNNNSSSNSSREEEQQLIESSDENRSAANEPENDTNTNINNNGNHNTSNDSNAGEGLRRRRIQHRSPEHHANITNNINDGNNNNSNNNNNNNHKKPIMFIETLLDADDGLNNHAVEWIQTKAVQKTKEHRKQQNKQLATTNADTADTNADTNLVDPGASLNSTWWFLCGTDHIEWHNRNIYKLSTKEYSTFGLTSGLVGLRQSPLFCTSAGFTRIGITNSRSSSINASANVNSNSNSNSKSNSLKFPKDAYSNHALTFYFPECTHVHVAVDRNVDALPTNGNYSACWHREFPGESFVIKSRTITSDSMDHMNPRRADDDYRDISWLNKTDYPLLINETEHLWLDLMQNFSIDRSRAWETSVYLFRNRRRILRQNRDLRCSPGFPCYVEAQRNHIRMENYWYALEHESGAKIAQGKASSEILKKIMDMNAKRHTKPK